MANDFVDKITIAFLIFLVILLAVLLFQLHSLYEVESYMNNTHCDYSFTIAPSNYLNESQIIVYENYVIINVSNLSMGRFAGTGSMLPTLNENSNSLRYVPTSESDIHVGDIVTYEEQGEGDCELVNNITLCPAQILVVHRVVQIGNDFNGTYYILKGDNNNVVDNKVRFKDIKSKTIALLY